MISIALGVWALVLVVANGTSLGEFFTDTLPLGAALAITFPIVGALIASRRPDNWVGWIFCVIGITQGLVEFAYQYALYSLVTEPGSLPGGDLMSWLSTWAWVPGFGLLTTFLLLVFPTGRLPSRRWRPVGVAVGTLDGIPGSGNGGLLAISGGALAVRELWYREHHRLH